jgi:hypothetical protein
LFALVLSRFWTPCACTYYITDAGLRLDSLQPQDYITDACSPWQPRDYITGLRLYLDSLRKKVPDKLASGAHALGNMLVKETAVIGAGCLIGHACVAAVLPLSVLPSFWNRDSQLGRNRPDGPTRGIRVQTVRGDS